MAGGVGAGKSRVLNAENRGIYDLIIDGTLRESKWATETFKAAIKNRWVVNVSHLQRPIGIVAQGVIERADETGRTFPLRHLFSSHRDAQDSLLTLHREFSGERRVRFKIYYTSGVEKGVNPSVVDLSQIDVNGPLSYSNKNYDRRRDGRNGKEGNGGNPASIEASGRRAISKAFEEAVREGYIEERILRLLARKDEGLEKILSDHGISVGAGTSAQGRNSNVRDRIDQPGKVAYERVINANLASLGKHLADQSRSFGEAAKAADAGGSQRSGEAASPASPGRALAAWAREKGKLVPESEFQKLTLVSESTSEHVVYYRASDDRAVKSTRELYYGQVPGVVDGLLVSVSASPAEYLRRMALQTAVFHSDIRLEGVAVRQESLYLDDPSEAPHIVVSQPWIESEGVATFQNIEDLLTKEGFSPIPNSFYGWVRSADGVVILDASPDNFIMTHEGPVPIDLQMNVFSNEQLRQAGLIKE